MNVAEIAGSVAPLFLDLVEVSADLRDKEAVLPTLMIVGSHVVRADLPVLHEPVQRRARDAELAGDDLCCYQRFFLHSLSLSQPYCATVQYSGTMRQLECSTGGQRMAQRRLTPLADRLWRKVKKDGPVPERRPDLGACWLWMGFRSLDGYGRIQPGRRSSSGYGAPLLVHRVSYELAVGPIPDGLTIDHLCFVTSCVNPTHLEAVTMGENVRRNDGMSARHGRATICKRGHPKTTENTYRSPQGGNSCAPCRKIRMAAFWAARGTP